MTEKIKTFTKATLSGTLIVIACAVIINSETGYIGAVLFSVALCGILTLGLPLYTGAIGYVKTPAQLISSLVILLGNIAGCVIAGFMMSIAFTDIKESAAMIAGSRMITEPKQCMDMLISSFFCGILMYVAVETYKSKNSYIGALLCVPAFIIAGFEHSIAYIAFVSAGLSYNPQTILTIFVCVVGNALGAIAIRAGSMKQIT